MRHRSPTNSHFGEDKLARRLYADDNPWCEAAPWLSKNVPKLGLTRYEPTSEVHHVFGAGRVDIVTNMLAVCRTSHDWFHANPKEGRLLGLWLKVQKRQFLMSEFEAVGWRDMPGFLDNVEPDNPVFVPLWNEMMDVFTKGGE